MKRSYGLQRRRRSGRLLTERRTLIGRLGSLCRHLREQRRRHEASRKIIGHLLSVSSLITIYNTVSWLTIRYCCTIPIIASLATAPLLTCRNCPCIQQESILLPHHRTVTRPATTLNPATAHALIPFTPAAPLPFPPFPVEAVLGLT